MIPLRSTERVSSPSIATGTLIAINTLVFLYQVTLPSADLNQLINNWGIVPDERPFHFASLLTSMFLHAGWLHLIGNMLYLWVFGRNLEDLIGRVQFVAFYLLCGAIAGVVHIIFNAYSSLPTIGASGAIAGVMGAFLIRFPRARISTLVIFIVFFTTMDLPAYLLLLFWFAMQFLSGFESLGEHNYYEGGTAYFAHIGGFLAGMLLIRLFPARQRFRAWYEES
jgi:membrane associated rhomboid family serine protease